MPLFALRVFPVVLLAVASTSFALNRAPADVVTSSTLGPGSSEGQYVSTESGRAPGADAEAATNTASLAGLSLPAANACQSPYDAFYESEPGVYGYWALCESSAPRVGYDYLGQWSFVSGFGNNGNIQTGLASPVADGETASGFADAKFRLANQGMSLNKNAGTLALWINADATSFPVMAESVTGINSLAGVAIKVSNAGSLCFTGHLVNSAGSASDATKCGFAANSWHRVVFSWTGNGTGGGISLYVDGVMTNYQTYSGSLSDDVYYYQLFPGCCNTGKAMSLAKVLIANQPWGLPQVLLDYHPTVITAPHGGVYVTAQELGVIHGDVLGFADNNQNLATPAIVSALHTGLDAAGFTSVRYAGGFGGISADAADWRGGATACTQNGGTVAAQNQVTGNSLDAFEAKVAAPLGLHMGYTVNYGSNPPDCNAGGDPEVNGGSLVRYANVTHHYGIKYWEIGNEQFAYGGGVIDLHPNAYLSTRGNSPTTYTQYEPAFYTAMKAADPSIQVAVPVSGPGTYNAELNFGYPVLESAKYDAVIFHPYPLRQPVNDGDTLYPDRVASASLNVRGALLAYQTILLNFNKPKDALWLTEWNGEYEGSFWSRQTMGGAEPLFTVMQLAEFMQAGVPYATWWAQGMTDVCSTYNYDYSGDNTYAWYNCGDSAPVYTGPVADAGEMQVGLKAGDLTPAGRGFQILAKSGFVAEGEHMLRTETDPAYAPWLASYAATHGTAMAVILINRDPYVTHTVPVQFAKKLTGTEVVQWTYGKQQYDAIASGDWSQAPVQTTTGSWSGVFPATLPPWSVNILILK